MRKRHPALQLMPVPPPYPPPRSLRESLCLAFLLGVLGGLVVFVFAGCAQTQIGDDKIADLGRDAEVVYYRGETGSRYVVLGQNESKSFREGARTIRFRDLLDFTAGASDEWSAVRASRNASDAATEQLAIETEGTLEAARIEALTPVAEEVP